MTTSTFKSKINKAVKNAGIDNAVKSVRKTGNAMIGQFGCTVYWFHRKVTTREEQRVIRAIMPKGSVLMYGGVSVKSK